MKMKTSLPGSVLSFAVLMAILSVGGCATPVTVQAPPEKVFHDWNGAADTMDEARYRLVMGTKGMVVSDDRMASEWGAETLRKGGNAIDAAVATAFALSVTRPHYASLGGGGFLVFCPAPIGGVKQKCSTIDYREVAPQAATRDMYLRNGKADSKLSLIGALASGVPGVVDGLLLALKKFGTFTPEKILQRPIELAEKGFSMSSYTESAGSERWEEMNGAARRIFGCGPGGIDRLKLAVCPVGTRLIQKDLARVLREVSKNGRDGFYKGWVAEKIVDSIRKGGGIFTLADLASYQAKTREPVVGNYLGLEVVSMPPPSSGGAVLIEMLGFAERAGKSGRLDSGFGSAASVHVLTHAMKLAFADRAEHFGDPDFVAVSVDAMVSKSYLDDRWRTFDPGSAREKLKAGILPEPKEGKNTTHFSIVDRFGNSVAITTTINQTFGSAFVAEGTGIVMNNEMDDFSAQPGVPNLFGLVAGEKNAISPGRRPLSSMSPTILRDDRGNVRMVIGALGGPRIISSVFLALVNRFQFGMSIEDAVVAPRFHHQWSPDVLRLETHGFAQEVRNGLMTLGYALEPMDSSGKISAIERFGNGRVWGAPDPRTEGAAAAE